MELLSILISLSFTQVSMAGDVRCDTFTGNTGEVVNVFPGGESPQLTLEQAKEGMRAYYAAWNAIAEVGRKIAPAPLSEADIDVIDRFYAKNLSLTQKDVGILGAPDSVIPAENGLAREKFIRFFLGAQPGSVHKPEYLCVDGNKISLGIGYYAPKTGQRLSPAFPQLEAKVNLPAMATYTVSNGVITHLDLLYDFKWFYHQSGF